MYIPKIWEDLPSEDTPVTAEDMNHIEQGIKNLYNDIYPIGIEVTFYTNEDKSKWLGFSWERCSIGKFDVGINENIESFNTIGKTGGELEHTLTLSEMPVHNHNVYFQGSVPFNDNYTPTNQGFESKRTPLFDLNVSGGTSDLVAGNTGGNQPHNNLPPYEVKAKWRRVS